MRGKIHNATTVEDLTVGSEPSMVVVAKIAAADFVGGLGEVVAGNAAHPDWGSRTRWKLASSPVVAEEVIVGVEGEAADVVRHIVGVSPGEASADLKVCGAARSGRGLTVGEGNEEGERGKNGEIRDKRFKKEAPWGLGEPGEVSL